MSEPVNVIRDLRRVRGQIWNVPEVVAEYPFGSAEAPWNSGTSVTRESWLDRFVYKGYRKHGVQFLGSLRGRFASAYFDRDRGVLFLARDWIGEVPFHLIATPDAVILANLVDDLQKAAADAYAYRYVRAVPQARFQEIDLSHVDPACVSLTMRTETPTLYLDFGELVEESARDTRAGLSTKATTAIRDRLHSSLAARAQLWDEPHPVLLSGGLDSFTVALGLKTLGFHVEGYTLALGQGSEDAAMARAFAQRLEIPHHVVEVDAAEVRQAFAPALRRAECYHLFNLYCAVGMVLLAEQLAKEGIRHAFCGEGVNEAVGDYQDWVIFDASRKSEVTLQRIDSTRLQRSEERKALLWGHSDDQVKSNRQLGSGLAKHAGSRMIKPFLAEALTLECPYFDPQLLALITSVPSGVLKDQGGKPGLAARVFAQDLEEYGIEADLIRRCKKVRLQDASELGRGGITTVLYEAGLDQGHAIRQFNRHFGADLDGEVDARRLAWTLGASA